MPERDIEGDGIKWEELEGGGFDYITACLRENEKKSERVSACSIGLALMLNEPNSLSFLFQFFYSVSKTELGKRSTKRDLFMNSFEFGIKAK